MLPLWSTLRALHLARRPALIGPDGELYPDTLVGDVRKVVERLGHALAHPRFDHAQLGDVRRAWRAAVRRQRAHALGLGWYHTHPDNLGFWWRDTRQLAEALGAVDARRAAIEVRDDRPVPTVGYADRRVLWADLRHWYLLRRAVRRDPASLLTYPATTVGEVAHVAGLLLGDRTDAGADALRARLAEVAGVLPSSAPYPDAAGFWCVDSRRAVGGLPPEVAP